MGLLRVLLVKVYVVRDRIQLFKVHSELKALGVLGKTTLGTQSHIELYIKEISWLAFGY